MKQAQQEKHTAGNKIAHLFREAEVPEPSEKVDQKGFVRWGENNLYGQFLNKLYYESSIHQGIINSKVTYIVGGGIKYEGPDADKWEAIRKNEKGALTWDEMPEEICLDDEISNTFYIRAKKDFITKMWYFDIIDFELIRPSECGTKYYYSENWATQQDPKKTKFREYKSLHEIDTDTDTECIFEVSSKSKQYAPGDLDSKKLTRNVFAVPGYSGSIVSIMADIEMNHFHHSESVNGFAGGTLINLANGEPPPEDKKETEAQIKDAVTNRKKKGGVIISYSDGKDRAPSVDQISGNDLDKRYIGTQEHLVNSIMVGHSVITPALFGIKTAGALGQNQELEIGYAIFKDNYAKKKQRKIAQAITYINQKLNGLQGKIEFNEYKLVLEQQTESQTPVADALNGMSPLLATKALEVMTINEIRALSKLPPLVDGDKLSSSIGSEPAAFKSQDKILNRLLSSGVDSSGLVILASKAVSDFSRIESDEAEFMAMHEIHKFAALTAVDQKILDLIKGGASYADLINEVGKPASYVSGRIAVLKNGGYLENEPKLKLTTKGSGEIEVNLRILYTYEERPDAPPLQPGGNSREFCSELLRANKAFTREEIDRISNDEGTSVWLYRGGWYHDPETDKNQPSCRHYWKMNLVTL